LTIKPSSPWCSFVPLWLTDLFAQDLFKNPARRIVHPVPARRMACLRTTAFLLVWPRLISRDGISVMILAQREDAFFFTSVPDRSRCVGICSRLSCSFWAARKSPDRDAGLSHGEPCDRFFMLRFFALGKPMCPLRLNHRILPRICRAAPNLCSLHPPNEILQDWQPGGSFFRVHPAALMERNASRLCSGSSP